MGKIPIQTLLIFGTFLLGIIIVIIALIFGLNINPS